MTLQVADVDCAAPGGGTVEVDAAAATGTAGVRPSRLLRIGLVALVLFAVTKLFVAEPALVHEDSMSPTLRAGDALVVDKLTYLFREPAVGEIVVAEVPGGGSVVKRVVAVGGDSVGLEDGVLVRNGVAVDEPYADHEQMKGSYWGPITVPDGHVFLMGDHRFVSVDSRNYGPVANDDVVGRLLVRVWPLGG